MLGSQCVHEHPTERSRPSVGEHTAGKFLSRSKHREPGFDVHVKMLKSTIRQWRRSAQSAVSASSTQSLTKSGIQSRPRLLFNGQRRVVVEQYDITPKLTFGYKMSSLHPFILQDIWADFSHNESTHSWVVSSRTVWKVTVTLNH